MWKSGIKTEKPLLLTGATGQRSPQERAMHAQCRPLFPFHASGVSSIIGQEPAGHAPTDRDQAAGGDAATPTEEKKRKNVGGAAGGTHSPRAVYGVRRPDSCRPRSRLLGVLFRVDVSSRASPARQATR